MTNDLLEDLLNIEAGPDLHQEEDDKLIPLKEEIDLIHNAAIRSFVRSILFNADAFWRSPSSNIEGFHPLDEMGSDGAILHTKRVVRIARTICRSRESSREELDLITAAALIHDVTKCLEINGESTFDSMHPYTVDHFAAMVMIKDHQHNANDNQLSSPNEIHDEECAVILRLVRCHMGPYSPIPETYPITPLEWALHLADVLATQLHIMIDGDNVKEWRWIEPKPRRNRTKIPKEDPPTE